jgi:hypothetical protein
LSDSTFKDLKNENLEETSKFPLDDLNYSLKLDMISNELNSEKISEFKRIRS